MRFENKVVLITGAGAGIGRAAAVMFAKEGARVVVNSKTSANGEETLQMVLEHSQGIYVCADVSKASDAEKMVSAAVDTFGQLDVVVNNAGIVIPGKVHDTKEEDWDNTFAVNTRGVFLVSKYAVKHMLRQGYGVIVNNASVVGIKGVKDRAAYSASKGAVISLTKAMAADYIEDNIRVNCICPGTVYTPSLEKRIMAFEDPAKAKKDFIERQPMGRLGEEDEIAETILFAASDRTKFLDGSVIVIDGGMSI